MARAGWTPRTTSTPRTSARTSRRPRSPPRAPCRRCRRPSTHYSPHLPPVLRFDPTGKSDKLPELIAAAGQRPLKPDEQRLLADALRTQEPWLEWATKREQHEKGKLEVDPVALHIHERVSAEAIVRTAMREDVQRDLFADPQQPYKEAVQFYKHDIDWANRLILGDSLQVMSSLARREGLAGKVQMIYMDPPYGIKFASNFQPEVGRKEVKEKDADMTREPEMVRAYRDAWNLGVHSYLAYMRDRLKAARELLSATGSLFVQISDENLHRVRLLLDEVMGAENFCGVLSFVKTAGQTSELLASVTNYLLWYARDRDQVVCNRLFIEKSDAEDTDDYDDVELSNGLRRGRTREEREGRTPLPPDSKLFQPIVLTSQSLGRAKGPGAACWFPVQVEGVEYLPTGDRRWVTNEEGMARLVASERVVPSGNTLRYVRYFEDFKATEVNNLWSDTGGGLGDVKRYVVQTSTKVVERCLLLTTSPGDLVLDPTCGSGTTACTAEQWGRRWITIDTSRVALAVARQRLITSRFEYYRTASDAGSSGKKTGRAVCADPGKGFQYKKVPHIKLRDIAQNAHLDPIFAAHEPRLHAALQACSRALKSVTSALRERLEQKLVARQRLVGKRGLTDADRRRWALPERAFEHWTVPFDVDPDWPAALTDAVQAYRRAWTDKMADVAACIAANAEPEDLLYQPDTENGVVRVTGPFTVEGVRPEELSLGDEGLFDGTPNEWERSTHASEGKVGAGYGEPKNNVAYLTRMVELLKQDGVTFLGNKTKKLARLEPLFASGTPTILHAEGTWEGAGDHNNIAVGFGPQYGPVTALQVEELIRAARRYDELIIAGFSFDAEASAAIEEAKHPKLRVHSAHIRPDVNPAMEGLLKDTPRSQLFSVFGQPEVSVKHTKEGWVCKLTGVDIYDPISNTVRSTGADKVAAWFLDSDFDGRCFCITQAFFPDKGAWDKIAAALKGKADEEAFEKLSGTTSIPFEAGRHKRIAVKVIDPRGNEVMAIRKLEV
jgi:adenine-specific DNA-methyltransferase